MFNGATSFPLLAIPLFILAGAIMNTSSLSRRLIAFASALFGFVRGGLAMINIGTSMFFAEISGSAVADVAAMGSILIPAMKKKGYPKEFAAAIMSSSATLAVIIPPSIPMILYAVMADASVVQIFVAGIVPGVLGGGGMMALSLLVRAALQLPGRGSLPVGQGAAHLQGRGLGLPAAGDHPRRHLRRHRHRHRRRGAGGAGGAVHRRRDLPRAELEAPVRGDDRRRDRRPRP